MSFRRAGGPSAVAAPLPGTRASPSACEGRRVSSGAPGLDGVLFGGLAQGSVSGIVRDAPSRHSATLQRYFVSEGVVSGHRCVVLSCGRGARRAQWLHGLPDVCAAPASQNADCPLSIAHEYRKYLESARSAAPDSSYCHSFHLGRPLAAEHLSRNAPEWVTVSPGAAPQSLLQTLREAIAVHHGLSRVLLTDIDPILLSARPVRPPGRPVTHQTELLRFFLALRTLVRSSSAVCLVDLPASLPCALTAAIAGFLDVLLEVEAFGSMRRLRPPNAEGPASAPELAGLEGVLRVRKVSEGLVPRAAVLARCFGICKSYRALSLSPLSTVSV